MTTWYMHIKMKNTMERMNNKNANRSQSAPPRALTVCADPPAPAKPILISKADSPQVGDKRKYACIEDWEHSRRSSVMLPPKKWSLLLLLVFLYNNNVHPRPKYMHFFRLREIFRLLTWEKVPI